MQKRLLTIQDYSTLGRCSMTVALPTVSACGIECVALPTAVLSNHTQFKAWTFADLTTQIIPTIDNWKSYNHNFDCIYTGYLTTPQIDITLSVINTLKRDRTIVFIDPAMADNGALYKGFNINHVEEMKKLISIADYIKPNVTEACLLTGTEYTNSPTRPFSFYKSLILKLAKLSPKNIILTGANTNENNIGILIYSRVENKLTYIEYPYLKANFHGTGDLFSSCLASLLTLNIPILKAINITHNYVIKSIQYTIDDKVNGLLYGPQFEKAIPYLISKIK